MCDYGYPAKSTVLFRYEGTFLQCERGLVWFKAGYGNQQWGSRPEINRYTMVYTAKIHQTYKYEPTRNRDLVNNEWAFNSHTHTTHHVSKSKHFHVQPFSTVPGSQGPRVWGPWRPPFVGIPTTSQPTASGQWLRCTMWTGASLCVWTMPHMKSKEKNSNLHFGAFKQVFATSNPRGFLKKSF
jgi:hypothetical protein